MAPTVGFVVYDHTTKEYLQTGPYGWGASLQTAKVFVVRENAEKRVENSFHQELRPVRVITTLELI